MDMIILTTENTKSVKEKLIKFLGNSDYCTYMKGMRGPAKLNRKEAFCGCDFNRVAILKGFKICGNMELCDAIDDKFQYTTAATGIDICLSHGLINIPINTTLVIFDDVLFIYYDKTLGEQCARISLRNDEEVNADKDEFGKYIIEEIKEITVKTNPMRKLRTDK